ncbi:MAG: pyrroline-5-carboxylate reductase, partial [Victivallales bacterium]|nr:pyrroline-5-carboxylate reductase [Victivallales bacterium]
NSEVSIMKIAFVGAGKMATAIVKGMLAAGKPFAKEDILASDVSAESAERFVSETGIECVGSPHQAVKAAEYVLLAVKPQNISEAAVDLKGIVSDKTLISIAAGVKIGALMEGFGAERVIRVMPNTPLTVGLGASVLAASPAATDEDRRTARAIFAASGIAYELEEDLIDAVTALSGSGPAYFFEMIDSMIEAGERLGLPADIARELTIQTAAGAAEMLKAKLGSARELRDAVTSPGGTTAAALEVMWNGDFRGLVGKALKSAKERSVELGNF